MSEPLEFRLLAITDRHLVQGDVRGAVLALARGAGGGGVAVLLREKDLTGDELYDLARTLTPELTAAGVPLLVHGRPDIARAAGAAGVHLAEDGLDPAAVGRQWPDLIVGRSTHATAAWATRGASYVTYGPTFDTPSKDGLLPPTGLAAFSRTPRSPIPVFALGGIDRARAEAAGAAGAAGVAAIRAIWFGGDPGAAARDLLAAFDAGRAARQGGLPADVRE